MKKKIVVIGSPGGGKSYFSSILSKIINVPVYHMDNIYWRQDKTHIVRDELVNAVDEIIDKEEWIIDGNYISTMEQRIKGADTIVYLDFATEQCIEGVKSRLGMKRDDIPWVEETLDKDFFEFVVRFREETKPRIENFLEQYKDKEVIRFKTREEMNRFLDCMQKGERLNKV